MGVISTVVPFLVFVGIIALSNSTKRRRRLTNQAPTQDLVNQQMQRDQQLGHDQLNQQMQQGAAQAEHAARMAEYAAAQAMHQANHNVPNPAPPAGPF